MKYYIPLVFVILLTIISIAALSCKESEVKIDRRNFYMGFSPWPYDNTQSAVDWVNDKILKEGDIISEHMETGVPWPEAYAGDPFPQGFIDDILSRTNRRGPNQKILLQINPLNINRDGIASYRGSGINMPLPDGWTSLRLNDDKVKAAFLNYARRIIDYFDPDYVVLGIEINLLIRNNPGLWPEYVELHQYVYTELKKSHPSLPLSVSVFCVPYFPEWSSEDNLQAQMDGLREIEPYVDYLSFSVHPFMSALLADQFPGDYLKRLFHITVKPVAIAESSYPAKKWNTLTEPILTFNGTEDKQDNFLRSLLQESDEAKARYVIWFSIRDYDALWRNALQEDPLALVWRDTGLYDEAGNERKAWHTWRKWFSFSVVK